MDLHTLERRHTAALLLVKARALPAGKVRMPSGIKRSPRALLMRAAEYLMASQPSHAGNRAFHWDMRQRPTRSAASKAEHMERRLNGELDASRRAVEEMLPMQQS